MRSPVALLLVVFLALPTAATAQSYLADRDATTHEMFTEVMTFAQESKLYMEPFASIVKKVGERFMGLPWVEGLLDRSAEESLVVDLTQFDCVLYVETVLALARGIAVEDYSYDAFARNLESLRYRSGRMEGYCSRLHYFTEWIADNEARGVVSNTTASFGGVPLQKRLTFMSEHRSSYPRMADDDSLFQGIRSMEESLTGMRHVHIPQDHIRSIYPHLNSGDIVATSTHVAGLDVSHVGFAYRHGTDEVGFLHASKNGGVKVSPDLANYVKSNGIQIGIIVARPLPPK